MENKDLNDVYNVNHEHDPVTSLYSKQCNEKILDTTELSKRERKNRSMKSETFPCCIYCQSNLCKLPSNVHKPLANHV